MPQANDELRAMFEDDQVALNVIDKNFVIAKGFVIRPRVEDYKPTEYEGNAIDYLCDEWDFAYDPLTEKELLEMEDD